MPLLRKGRRSYGASLYPLPHDLEFMDRPCVNSWRRLGLPSPGERPDAWLDSSPLKKKGFKTLKGCSFVFVMGDMEREEQCYF